MGAASEQDEPCASLILLYVTAPDEQAAQHLAERIVGERLAACVNIFPAMSSVYQWKGTIETAQEAVMIVKTNAAMAPAARQWIEQNHPYETPCILALPIDEDASSRAFQDWVNGEISPSQKCE